MLGLRSEAAAEASSSITVSNKTPNKDDFNTSLAHIAPFCLLLKLEALKT